MTNWTVIRALNGRVEAEGPSIGALPLPHRLGVALDTWETTTRHHTRVWLASALTMSTGVSSNGDVDPRRDGLHSSDRSAAALLQRTLPPGGCRTRHLHPTAFANVFSSLARRYDRAELPVVELNPATAATPGLYRTRLDDGSIAWQFGANDIDTGCSWIAASIPDRDLTVVVAGTGPDARWAKCFELDRQLDVTASTHGQHGRLPTGWAGHYQASDGSALTLSEVNDVAHVIWSGSPNPDPVIWFTDHTWLPSTHRLRPLGVRYAWGTDVASDIVRFNADSLSVVADQKRAA